MSDLDHLLASPQTPADFPLPQPVRHALFSLQDAGFKACLVGGCIRDLLLNGQPLDWDIATDATPDEMKAVFGQERLHGSCESLGSMILSEDDTEMEITTFRREGDYADARHPSHVTFTKNLEEDLKRRDFTVNALAWSPGAPVTDLFGGLQDLKNGLIRTVGDPAVRFEEDALRLLRALRFSSRLGFEIEKATADALHAKKAGIALLSRERAFHEITGILLGKDLLKVGLDFADLLFEALPELEPMKGCPQECIYHSWDVWEHSLRTAALCPPEPLLRWAGLLHDIGKPACRTRDENGTDHFYGHPVKGAALADKLCLSLGMNAEWRKEIHMLVLRHDETFSPEDMLVLLSQIGPESARGLIRLHMADQGAHAPFIARQADRGMELLGEIDRLESSGACWRLDQLAVNGRDMQAIGLSGPAVGETLNHLLQAVIRFHVPNDHDLLLQAAKAHFESTVTAFISKPAKETGRKESSPRD